MGHAWEKVRGWRIFSLHEEVDRGVARVGAKHGAALVFSCLHASFWHEMWNVSWCTRRFWVQDSSSALQTLGDGTCIASLAGSNTKNAQLLARVFQDKFQINTIVPKNCAPKTYQSFQTPGHGTCIASLAGGVTKRAELLARIFQDKFHQRDCPKKQVPKTSQTVWKSWAKGHGGHALEKVLCWMLGFRSLCSEAN